MTFTLDSVEAIGLVATVILVASMCFNTKTFIGTLLMRFLNLVCSVVWIIYVCAHTPGLLSTLVSNILLTIINLYFLIIAVKNKDNFGK